MPDNLPARSEEYGGVKALWVPLDSKNGFCVETTLPTDDPIQRAAVLAVVEGQDVKGESLIGAKLFIGHYVIHPIELVNEETGESVQAARTLLLQPEGPPVSFVSTGVLKSIARISWATGRMPPFDPPVPVKLVQQSTGRGRRTYKLVPLEG